MATLKDIALKGRTLLVTVIKILEDEK